MDVKFYRKVLKNGMTIIFEKRDIPVVSVAFAVRHGGVNEAGHEKGISHFIEHMLYKGTPARGPKQIAEEIEKNGGDLNGFTDETVTAYYCKIPSKHLDIALEVLSDIVKNPLFREEELEKERKVIFEEMKMYKDDPKRRVLDQIQTSLYEEPFGISLIGTEKTMKSIDRNKIVKKFKEIYQPNNMVLCVVGDADFKNLVDFVEKNFSNEKGKISKLQVKKKNEVKTEKRKGIDQANLVFAYHVPLSTNKKSYAAKILSVLMAGGLSSRLWNEIREKRNLAYAVKGVSNVHRDFAHNLLYVGTMKEHIEKVKKLILKEYEDVSKNLTQKELDETKEQIIGNYYIDMEDSILQMTHLLYFEMNGNAKTFYEFEKEIKKTSLNDVKELAETVKDKNYSFFALVPE
ncbi:MAG: pitrilysin family protein [archaeon]